MRLYQNSEARLELTIKYLKELRKIKNTKETDKQLEEKAKKFVNDNNRLTTHINAIEAQNTDKYYKELSEELGAEVERELGNSKIPGAYARIFHLYFKKENSPEDRKYNIDLYKKFMDPNFAAKKVTETVKEALELDKKLLYPKTVEEGVKTFTSNPTLFKKLFVLDSCLNELIVNPTLAKVLENNYSLFQTGAQIATMATLPANNLYITLPVEDNNDYMLLANNMEMSKIPADYLQYEGYIPSKSGGKFDESTIQYFSQHLLLGMNLDTNAKINKYLADLDKNVSFCTAKVNGTETTISKALEATTNKKNKVEFKEFSSKEMDNLMVILNGDPITPKKSVVVDTENDIINTNENIINTNTKENNISLDEDIIETDPNDMHIRRIDNSKKETSNRGMTEKSIITDDDAFAYEGDNIDFEESKVDNRISIDGENYNIGEVDNITVVSNGFTNKSSDPIFNEITFLVGEPSIVEVSDEVRNAELFKMEHQGVVYDPYKTKKENFTNALKTIVNNGGSIGELKHCTRSLEI